MSFFFAQTGNLHADAIIFANAQAIRFYYTETKVCRQRDFELHQMASYASGYPLCQKPLVGVLPNPLPGAEVPSAAARFANAFSATAICLVHVQGRACAKHKKKRAGFRGLTSSEPDSSSFISQKIFQLVPKIAALIRLHDKKKSLAKIIGLWHNGSRTIFQAD